jgi:hypothetical protein
MRAVGGALPPLNMDAANADLRQLALHTEPAGRVTQAFAAPLTSSSADGARGSASEERDRPGSSRRPDTARSSSSDASPDAASRGGGGGSGGGIMSRLLGFFGRGDDTAVVAHVGQKMTWVYDEKCAHAPVRGCLWRLRVCAVLGRAVL